MTAPLATRRFAATAGAVAFVFAIGGFALLARGGDAQSTPGATAAGSDSFGPTDSPILVAVVTPFDPTSSPGSHFQPIDMFATPRQPSHQPSHPAFRSTDVPFHPSPARPVPEQPVNSATAKAA